jgi:HD-GYP domain-containing protein (c-di-GMP phosphodiesterase class II)
MLGRITERRRLVVLLSAGQLLCLGLAVLWFTKLVEQGTRSIVQQRILQSSQQFAAETAILIREMELVDLTPGSSDWQRLQRLVVTMRLPNDGFLCIIDGADGTVLCHPEIEARPALISYALGLVELAGPGGRLTLLEAGAQAEASPGSGVGTGQVRLDDGTHLVAVRALPELGVHVVAHQREESVRAVIREFVTRIRWVGLAVTVVFSVLLALVSRMILRRYDNRLASINENLEQLVEKRSQALLQSRSAVILGLAKLAESRDDETGQHLERIRGYVKILGEQLIGRHPEVTPDFVNTIVETSALHDIGKVGVPDDVLLKPGKLTEEERQTIRKHTTIGGDTLLAVKQQWVEDQFLVTACEIAFSHHERWDGSGYPFGLEGELIPLSGRIVALADVYDALTTPRVYKPALSHDEAKAMIVEGSGKQFDPKIVDAFLAAEDKFKAVREELSQSGDRSPV